MKTKSNYSPLSKEPMGKYFNRKLISGMVLNLIQIVLLFANCKVSMVSGFVPAQIF